MWACDLAENRLRLSASCQSLSASTTQRAVLTSNGVMALSARQGQRLKSPEDDNKKWFLCCSLGPAPNGIQAR